MDPMHADPICACQGSVTGSRSQFWSADAMLRSIYSIRHSAQVELMCSSAGTRFNVWSGLDLGNSWVLNLGIFVGAKCGFHVSCLISSMLWIGNAPPV